LERPREKTNAKRLPIEKEILSEFRSWIALLG
jgi:hypothetical protein